MPSLPKRVESREGSVRNPTPFVFETGHARCGRSVSTCLHCLLTLARELPTQGRMLTQRNLNRRQHPRIRVSWPVVVKAGKSRYLSYSVDLSLFGAKVRTNARLVTGTAVELELVPPGETELRVAAVVWRVDADGLAFLFSRAIQHRLLRAA